MTDSEQQLSVSMPVTVPLCTQILDNVKKTDHSPIGRYAPI